MRSPFPDPVTYLERLALTPYKPGDQYDPPVERIEEARMAAAGIACEKYNQQVQERLDQDACREVEDWALANTPDIQFVSPVVVYALIDLAKDRECTITEVIESKSPGWVANHLRECATEEIRMERQWFLINDSAFRKLDRVENLKTAFNALPKDDNSRHEPEATKLVRQYIATHHELVEIDRRLRDEYGARGVWNDEERKVEEDQVAALASELNDYLDLHHAVERAERLQRRRTQHIDPAPVVEHCAEPGCPRDRHFFDEDGIGYCKRHGNERGLRPHGKVA